MSSISTWNYIPPSDAAGVSRWSFTCPPFDYDAAPSDFLRMAPETVGVHGWMLHVPDYVHGLDQRKAIIG